MKDKNLFYDNLDLKLKEMYVEIAKEIDQKDLITNQYKEFDVRFYTSDL